MKFASTFLAAAAAAALIGAPEARTRPTWEIGVGGFATYGPVYYGSSDSQFGGFPVGYFTYRGEHFSIMSNGLYDVDADNENPFELSVSVDLGGNVDSEDRLGLEKIDYIGEIGPSLVFGLYANGRSRVELTLDARAAFEWDQGYVGFVAQPELAYLTTLNAQSRLGLFVAPKFGFDGYNDVYYETPTFEARDGYIGTDFGMRYVHDLSDRLRLSGVVRATAMGGSRNVDSPLHNEDWNAYVRVGLTYSIWRSDETTED